jgi:hypothetical protein
MRQKVSAERGFFYVAAASVISIAQIGLWRSPAEHIRFG